MELTLNRPLRRSFMKGLLGTTSFWMAAGSTQWAEALAAEAAQSYQPTFFDMKEYKFLEAASDRLFPSDHNSPGGKALGVAEFIDRQMQTPYGHGENWYMSGPFQQGPANLGYQLPFVPRDLYRKGIAGVETYARQQYGKEFTALAAVQQDEILTALEGGSVQLGEIPGRVFFEQLRTNTLEGVFADPLYGGNRGLAGWVMLGFPGARADFMDWVNQEGAPYPIGPVSILGRPRKMGEKHVDAIIVGAGWAGAILAKELTEAGLSVVMLERGAERTTQIEGAYPDSIDELRGAVRKRLFQNLSQSTVTIRNTMDQTALPYRQLAAFLPGEGVGGAGLHWSGVHFRVAPEDLRLRSSVVERYGEKFIPEGMNLQDYGVTYEELEPFFDKAEKVFGTSGEAYKVQGKVVGNGNVFSPDRSNDFPLPVMKDTFSASVFRDAAKSAGYHPYALPAANASRQYTNTYGCQMGPCNFCGYCSGYDCYLYSKASPNVNILPVLRQDPKFSLIPNAHVLRVDLDSTKTKATGVTYLDTRTRKETSLSADLVILGAFQFNNVHLMLVSGIGKPYDPVSNTGTVGRNFVYQTITSSRVWLPSSTYTNQFVGAGGAGVAIDDFNSMNFDHGPLGFVGGSPVWVNQAGMKPIAAATGAGGGGTPRWGSAYKDALIDTYKHSLGIDAHGSNMAYRDVYLDLDPTWKDAYGQPLLRMTFTWKDNDIRMNQYVVSKIEPIARAMGATKMNLVHLNPGQPFDTRKYQTTHLGGGAIMGENPQTSALNRYLQSWDVSNVFVIGSNAFPQGMGYNPTGMVAALAYWAAHHIRTTYLKSPGPLVQA